MSIIITLLVFNINVPVTITANSMYEFTIAIFILFISFMVVGTQWLRHRRLFSNCEIITNKIIWLNFLFLFFLALLPLFTKWLVLNRDEIVAAVGYNLVFLALLFSFNFLQKAMFKVNNIVIDKNGNRGEGRKGIMIFSLIFIVIFLIITIISFIKPGFSIAFFLILPVLIAIARALFEDLLQKRDNDSEDQT